MSLILDALKRAEAERSRGRTPELLASAPLSQPVRASGAAGLPVWAWMLGAVLVLGAVAATLAWLLRGAAPGSSSPSSPAVAVARPAAPAGESPSRPPVGMGGGVGGSGGPALVVPSPPGLPPVMSTPPQAMPSPPPASTNPPLAGPMPAQTRAAPPAATNAPAVASVGPPPPPESAVRAPLPATAGSPAVSAMPAVSTASPATAAPAPAAAAPLPRLAELPEALRQQLPPLAASGSVYAERPAERMVILNGAVWREQDSPAPGLTIESIGLRQVTLNFRGTRFVLPL